MSRAERRARRATRSKKPFGAANRELVADVLHEEYVRERDTLAKEIAEGRAALAEMDGEEAAAAHEARLELAKLEGRHDVWAGLAESLKTRIQQHKASVHA